MKCRRKVYHEYNEICSEDSYWEYIEEHGTFHYKYGIVLKLVSSFWQSHALINCEGKIIKIPLSDIEILDDKSCQDEGSSL